MLKTVTDEYPGGSLADGNELAKSLRIGFEVVYGTAYSKNEGLYLLGLRRPGGANPEFPKGGYE